MKSSNWSWNAIFPWDVRFTKTSPLNHHLQHWKHNPERAWCKMSCISAVSEMRLVLSGWLWLSEMVNPGLEAAAVHWLTRKASFFPCMIGWFRFGACFLYLGIFFFSATRSSPYHVDTPRQMFYFKTHFSSKRTKERTIINLLRSSCGTDALDAAASALQWTLSVQSHGSTVSAYFVGFLEATNGLNWLTGSKYGVLWFNDPRIRLLAFCAGILNNHILWQSFCEMNVRKNTRFLG